MRKNPHVRICGGLGSATTLVYPTRNGNPAGDFSKAPRCGAKTRRGTECQCPAMPNTETMHLVERFTRVDADTLEYEFTLTDPAKFTRPWSARIPLTTNQAARGVTQGPLYEYACHEGNYSIANILSGARADDGAAEASEGTR